MRSRSPFRIAAAAPAVLCLLAWMAPCSTAADPRDEAGATIQAQIAAGEFAPALAATRRVSSVKTRDELLGQIAAAQARAGAREASLNTASEMSSDQARAGAISDLRNQPLGAAGGAQMADFESLINLIQTTVSPTTWSDVGGAGTIETFEGGVHVDPRGVLKPPRGEDAAGALAELRAASAPGALEGRNAEGPQGTGNSAAAPRVMGGDGPAPAGARLDSPLRKVSLTRLEKQVQLRLAAGRMPTEEMQLLAGLERIRYVFVYPETGDLVVAGPAGDWKRGAEGRIVRSSTGHPVVRLDDLVVLLRRTLAAPGAPFGCTIQPRPEGLARIQEFVALTNRSPLEPFQRPAWLAQLRAQLGEQDIEVYGIDPSTRAARVLVEADYRMKRVAMGLERGVPGVPSYLALVKIPPGGSAPPMGVLRWWFTLNYEAVAATPDRRALALRGQGVQVLSENEKLTAEGQRVHTGQSDQWTRQFAESFTEHFEALALKYPVYGELRNIFDLAVVCALVQEEGIAAKLDWHLTRFGENGSCPVLTGPAPRTVQSVVNHRVIQRVHIVAGVSGGVRINPSKLVAREAVAVESNGALGGQQAGSVPKALPGDAWWWD